MKRILLTTAAVAGVLAVAALVAAPTLAHGPGDSGGSGGYGMMGGGYGNHMMGGGFGMGYGAGQGFDCPGAQQATLNEPLSVDDVKAQLERHLAMRGNPNLEVGEVVEKDQDTITAEIVTKDGSLVRSFEIDRKTGHRTATK